MKLRLEIRRLKELEVFNSLNLSIVVTAKVLAKILADVTADVIIEVFAEILAAEVFIKLTSRIELV